MKVVFVCKHGETRSAYAATKLRELDPRIETDNFGIASGESNEECANHLAGADLVIVMEEDFCHNVEHIARLAEPAYCGEICCWNVADDGQSLDTIDQLVQSFIEEKFNL